VDADLQDMYRYTRRTWGQAQATRYARQLPQRFRMLAEHLHAGTRREDLQPSGLHSFAHGSHMIFYQSQPYGVLIVRVLHGSLDVRRHVGGGKEP